MNTIFFNDFGFKVDNPNNEITLTQAMEYASISGDPICVDKIKYYISLSSSYGFNSEGKQERYKGNSGEDLIDRWAREETSEIFRAKIMAQLDRYTSRYGKKDNVLQEAKKIQDYANRLVAYEESLISDSK